MFWEKDDQERRWGMFDTPEGWGMFDTPAAAAHAPRGEARSGESGYTDHDRLTASTVHGEAGEAVAIGRLRASRSEPGAAGSGWCVGCAHAPLSAGRRRSCEVPAGRALAPAGPQLGNAASCHVKAFLAEERYWAAGSSPLVVYRQRTTV